MSSVSGRDTEGPTITLESVDLDDETVVVLTQADNERAWVQSDTAVAVDP